MLCLQFTKLVIIYGKYRYYSKYFFADKSFWDAALYVPHDVFGTYKSTEPWRYFGTIKTGIADITSLPVVVQNNGGTITVTGADDGTIVEVYTMAGTKLGKAKTSLNTATIHTNMQQGDVVIVKVGGKAVKVAL